MVWSFRIQEIEKNERINRRGKSYYNIPQAGDHPQSKIYSQMKCIFRFAKDFTWKKRAKKKNVKKSCWCFKLLKTKLPMQPNWTSSLSLSLLKKLSPWLVAIRSRPSGALAELKGNSNKPLEASSGSEEFGGELKSWEARTLWVAK